MVPQGLRDRRSVSAAWGGPPLHQEPAVYRDSRLAGLWDELTDRLQRWTPWPAGGQLKPALSGPLCPLGLTVLCRGADPQRADDVLGALVRLAAPTVTTTPARCCSC